MNPMNPYDNIEWTHYLQTEGRRRAAALSEADKAQAAAEAAKEGTPATDKIAAAQPAQQQQQQQQQDSRASSGPLPQPGSLSAVLVQMGVTPRRRP